ncbi:MAG: hypothetical protein N4J56_004229 [Chroococcidiopsis sp. SAG 2025]|nr:hypothetical protein [Chroococcidiopsis sp. SAG 2025]
MFSAYELIGYLLILLVLKALYSWVFYNSIQE